MIGYGACDILYKNSIIKTKLIIPYHTIIVAEQTGEVLDPETGLMVPVYTDTEKKVYEDYVVLDVPVKIYGYNIISLGKDLSYRLNYTSLKNVEVIAKIDYKAEDDAIIQAWNGNLTSDWEKVKKDADYKKHYPVTKETALGTYDSEGAFLPYTGADKDESVMFCQWEKKVK